jgi:hypothetical protein
MWLNLNPDKSEVFNEEADRRNKNLTEETLV